MPDEALAARILRLERAVILLQAVALHADSVFKSKEEKEIIVSLGELTGQMAEEHRASS